MTRAVELRERLLAGRWFRGLPPPFQDALVAMALIREVRPGNVLFARGEASDGMYAVLEGQLRACIIDDRGKEGLLTVLEPPSWVGEIPFFDGLPRTHNLVADGDGLVAHVPREPLLDFLDREPRYWRDFARLPTSKLRWAFLAIEDAQLLPVAARVAHRLVVMAEGYGEWSDRSARAIGVSQETLAAMVSTSRQTINQVLKHLEADGLVKLQYGRVEIVDLEGLRRTLPLRDSA